MRSEHPDWIALAKTQETGGLARRNASTPLAMIGPDGQKRISSGNYFMLIMSDAEFIRAKAYERLGQRAKALESALASCATTRMPGRRWEYLLAAGPVARD